jgi:hypothetical protein
MGFKYRFQLSNGVFRPAQRCTNASSKPIRFTTMFPSVCFSDIVGRQRNSPHRWPVFAIIENRQANRDRGHVQESAGTASMPGNVVDVHEPAPLRRRTTLTGSGRSPIFLSSVGVAGRRPCLANSVINQRLAVVKTGSLNFATWVRAHSHAETVEHEPMTDFVVCA